MIGLLEVRLGSSWVAGVRDTGNELWKFVGSLVIGLLEMSFGSSWVAVIGLLEVSFGSSW